ncbi:MAG: ATP-binding protein involved in chromosome partitioning [Halobacteriales archaeon]|jgi:ATP-binding protein involved in chromosome partitioning
MDDEVTVETVEDAIADVTHPEVDATLVDLGMIDDVEVEGDEATIEVAIPMAGIPDAIKQLLARRLAEPVNDAGAELRVQFVVMDEETRERFFRMEEENWSGLDPEEEGDSTPDSTADSPF